MHHLHVAKELPDPHISSMSRLEQVLLGIKSAQAKSQRPGRPRLPMALEILLNMRKVWEKQADSQNNKMLHGQPLLYVSLVFKVGGYHCPVRSRL